MLTTERQAQKQPFFKESVTAHWSSFFALKMFGTEIICRNSRFLKIKMVAERSVSLKSFIAIQNGDIRNENVGMSNDKHCEKQCRLKFKVSKTRLIRFGNLVNRSLRKRRKSLFNEIKIVFSF